MSDYLGKISLRDARELLHTYKREEPEGTLADFLDHLNRLDEQNALFNKHGKLLRQEFPRVSEEAGGLLNVAYTLDEKLHCQEFKTEVKIATEDNPAPGYDADLVVTQKAYGAIAKDAAKLRKKMPGELWYSVDAGIEIACGFEFHGMRIWNPEGKIIHKDDGEEV